MGTFALSTIHGPSFQEHQHITTYLAEKADQTDDWRSHIQSLDNDQWHYVQNSLSLTDRTIILPKSESSNNLFATSNTTLRNQESTLCTFSTSCSAFSPASPARPSALPASPDLTIKCSILTLGPLNHFLASTTHQTSAPSIGAP